jgi:hypothetical protein
MPSAISNQLVQVAPLLGLEWEEITNISTIINTPGIDSNTGAVLNLTLRAVSAEGEWLIYSVNSLFHKI